MRNHQHASERPVHLRAHAPRPDAKETRESAYDLLDDEQVYETRLPTSTRRYRPSTTSERQQGRTRDVMIYHGEYAYAPPPRARASAQRALVQVAPPPSRRNGGGVHPLFWVGVGMFLLFVGYLALTLLAHWWLVYQDDQHYGRPRTFQIDAVVGHNHDSVANPSHFLAINLHRHIEVIELPAGDPQHAKVYLGPVLLGEGQDLAVVTLSFADVNGDGKPDLLIHVAQSQIVLLNDGEGFRPPRAGEQINQPPTTRTGQAGG